MKKNGAPSRPPPRHGGEDWKLYAGDCVKVMAAMPKKSFDMIFADPPYNLQLKNALYRPNQTKVNGVADAWDKFSSFADYDAFCRAWLFQCRRLLNDSGALWVIGSYHNIHRIGALMQDMGFWLLNDITWHKTNPMPNFRGVRFTNATETLLWAKKSEKQKRHTFNHQAMKSLNGGKQMTSVWRIPLCTGRERIKDEGGKKAHSTQKPEELLRRVILSSTRRGDRILDPFVGSGTTCAVARKLRRESAGIDRERGYLTIAARRLKNIYPADFEKDIVDEPPRAAASRVPFAHIVAQGMLRAGQKLYAPNDGGSATILKNGEVRFGGAQGSIHKMGARAQNTAACNGWKFWRYQVGGGEKRAIDALRDACREKEKRAG